MTKIIYKYTVTLYHYTLIQVSSKSNFVVTRVLMKGKLIKVAYTLRTYGNTEFVNKNKRISVRFVSKGVKSIMVSYDQNISLIFYVKMNPTSGFDIHLVFTLPPKDSTLQYKNAYISEITFLALVP